MAIKRRQTGLHPRSICVSDLRTRSKSGTKSATAVFWGGSDLSERGLVASAASAARNQDPCGDTMGAVSPALCALHQTHGSIDRLFPPLPAARKRMDLVPLGKSSLTLAVSTFPAAPVRQGHCGTAGLARVD